MNKSSINNISISKKFLNLKKILLLVTKHIFGYNQLWEEQLEVVKAYLNDKDWSK